MHPSYRRTSVASAPSLLLFALLAPLACGDGGTGPKSTGVLVLPAITGLPVGASADVHVEGPRGYANTIAMSGAPDTLRALAAGSYRITAASVVADETRWAATPASQDITVGTGARATARPFDYAMASARLVIGVVGLPTGTEASVRLAGPGNLQRTIVATSTLSALEPGTYTIAAADVQVGGVTWRPAPGSQALQLGADATTTLSIDYGAGSANLAIAIDGVPGETDAAVSVTGPAGYARTVPSSTTLQHLEPGAYTVRAAPFSGSLASYAPATTTQAIDVPAGGNATASVTFASSALALGVEQVVQGLANPSFLTAPDGDARLFVVERAGRVRIVKDGALLAAPFLDIAARVNSVGERGMLGMAFDPQYATNGAFYVFYVQLGGSVAVERFTSTPGSDVAAASAGIVISIPHGGSEHHGGMIAFGPDGMLYVGPGDGGCCGDPHDNAQSLGVLLGKLLRLDVHAAVPPAGYAIPAGNPLVGHAGARAEIWAWGLRNPWRFSFDAPTRRLYVGDVGQDAIEEVDAIATAAAGRNFGWPTMEGLSCYRPSSGCATAGLTLPVQQYAHAEGCAVTGGYVYRGTRIPELTGHYLYADYCRGWLRSFRLTSAGTAAEQHAWSGVTVPAALSFGRDGAGELYVVSGAGSVWRIVKR